MKKKMSRVTTLELFLFLLVAASMLASIIMCICLFLILPSYWVNSNYVYNRSNETLLIHDCRCSLLASKTRSGFTGFGKTSFSRRDSKQVEASFSRNKIKAFPYLVSLSIPAYVDEPWEMRFACSGVVVAKNWVLAGGTCIIEYNEFEYLKVRELSDYWSKGGVFHTVISASLKSKSQPLALKIKSEFSVTSQLTPTPVRSIQNLMSIGWREPDILRKKFEPFLVDLFTESKCWVCVPAILQKASCDYSSLGKPLIANCNYLYGMQCKTSLQSGALQFLQFPENRHENWWLFMEDAALDRARDMTVYGILDTNVESCQPYDFGKTFDEQKLTLPPDNPKAIKTMLPELLFGTARARMEKGAGFVTKT